MGSKSSSEERKSLPPIYFVNKQKSTVFYVTGKTDAKIKFSKSVRIPLDAAIGYLPNHKILICGGTDSSKSLSNKVFILNPSNGTNKNASNLPIHSKAGFLHYYKN